MDKYLVHHGILGQKWGVRRYQNKDGTYTAAGKKHRKTTSVASKYEKEGKASRKNLENYKVGDLYQYKTANGNTIKSALFVEDLRRQEVDAHRVLVNDHVDIEVKPDSFYAGTTFDHVISDPQQIAMHDRYMLTDKDMRECNLGYGLPGTIYNCAKCAATMELRLRGLDVNAGRSDFGAETHAMELWFPGAQRIEYSSDSVQEALMSYGPETSGTLAIRYPNNGGGHAVHWTNNSDGVFEIQDGQPGRRFSSFAEMAEKYGVDMNAPVATYRLDECAWDMKASASDSVIRTSGSKADPFFYSYQLQDRVTGEQITKWIDMTRSKNE